MKCRRLVVVVVVVVIIIIIIQFFIIYVPSQQLQGQLRHSVDTGNCIKDKHNIKATATYNNSILIQLFIYLHAELNSQWSITESARIQTTAIRQHRTKQTKTTNQRTMYQLRLFKLQLDLLKNICRFTDCICSRYTSCWRAVAEGATERGKVMYVPSRNTNADCFQYID
jgi:hypothetical protein